MHLPLTKEERIRALIALETCDSDEGAARLVIASGLVARYEATVQDLEETVSQLEKSLKLASQTEGIGSALDALDLAHQEFESLRKARASSQSEIDNEDDEGDD
jgi:hypothetical protein